MSFGLTNVALAFMDVMIGCLENVIICLQLSSLMIYLFIREERISTLNILGSYLKILKGPTTLCEVWLMCVFKDPWVALAILF